MSNVYIHPVTKQRLDSLAIDLPQSIVFTGPEGVGLKAAVKYIADILQTQPIYVLPEKDEKIDIEKGTINVDVIRRLYGMTKTIENGTRLIVIDYAERMASQAQNAFLKLLEEPGANTHFVLLTHAVSKLLPTIQSRVQPVEIHPITTTDSQRLLDELSVTDPQQRTQLLFIADGLPAQLTLLAQDAKLFEQRATVIRDARRFLQGSMYERLKIALTYKEDRDAALLLLVDAMKLLQSSLKTANNSAQVKKISAILKVYERIESNGNIRLQLASLVV